MVVGYVDLIAVATEGLELEMETLVGTLFPNFFGFFNLFQQSGPLGLVSQM